MDRLEGVREGDRVVLHGEEDGHPIRWTFNEIRQNSFLWRGETCRNIEHGASRPSFGSTESHRTQLRSRS